VPRCGQLASTGDLGEPYRLIDAGGAVVEPVAAFLRELLAAGRSPATLRSYGMDLLRWWRFLGAVDVGWQRGTRSKRTTSAVGFSWRSNTGEGHCPSEWLQQSSRLGRRTP
jgi:hypothetical protein